jgi:hypothetical protein
MGKYSLPVILKLVTFCAFVVIVYAFGGRGLTFYFSRAKEPLATFPHKFDHNRPWNLHAEQKVNHGMLYFA